MQAKFKQDDFLPITVSLTAETPEDARALYALFNHTTNAALIGEDVADDISARLSDFRISHGEINNGITYDQFYAR